MKERSCRSLNVIDRHDSRTPLRRCRKAEPTQTLSKLCESMSFVLAAYRDKHIFPTGKSD